MTDLPSQELSVEEFHTLRATIRERGSLRLFVAPITFVAWAALVVVAQIWLPAPVFSLVPLLVLAAGFESVLSLHIGVERIGRYLQVFYELDHEPVPGWEHAAMNARPTGSPFLSIDPLFAPLFLLAAVANLLLAMLGRLMDPDVTAFWVELTSLSLLHALFAIRVLSGRRFAAGQRERDLAMYRALAGTRRGDRSN